MIDRQCKEDILDTLQDDKKTLQECVNIVESYSNLGFFSTQNQATFKNIENNGNDEQTKRTELIDLIEKQHKEDVENKKQSDNLKTVIQPNGDGSIFSSSNNSYVTEHNVGKNLSLDIENLLSKNNTSFLVKGVKHQTSNIKTEEKERSQQKY